VPYYIFVFSMFFQGILFYLNVVFVFSYISYKAHIFVMVSADD